MISWNIFSRCAVSLHKVYVAIWINRCFFPLSSCPNFSVRLICTNVGIQETYVIVDTVLDNFLWMWEYQTPWIGMNSNQFDHDPSCVQSSLILESCPSQTLSAMLEVSKTRAGQESLYHSSPSRNKSDGMSSMTSWGRSNLFPLRENMAFFKGFQNPRIPSYFSNTHLNNIENLNKMNSGSVNWEGFHYQLVGLMEELVKKQALVGSPISSIWVICLSKNPDGGDSLMGVPWSPIERNDLKSERCNAIVAAKLLFWNHHD